MGSRSITVRAMVGNQDVSPPMSDADEDDDDVDGSLIITKSNNTAISKNKKGTVKRMAAVLSLAGGGRGVITPIRPF
jgi:hypothetical protein